MQKKIFRYETIKLFNPDHIFEMHSAHSGFFPGFLFHGAKHVMSKLSALKVIFRVKLSRIVHQN